MSLAFGHYDGFIISQVECSLACSSAHPSSSTATVTGEWVLSTLEACVEEQCCRGLPCIRVQVRSHSSQRLCLVIFCVQGRDSTNSGGCVRKARPIFPVHCDLPGAVTQNMDTPMSHLSCLHFLSCTLRAGLLFDVYRELGGRLD